MVMVRVVCGLCTCIIAVDAKRRSRIHVNHPALSVLQLQLIFRLRFPPFPLPQRWDLLIRDPTNDKRHAILQGRA